MIRSSRGEKVAAEPLRRSTKTPLLETCDLFSYSDIMMFSPSLLLAALSGVAVWAAPAPVSSLEDAPIDIAVRQWGGNYIFSDWHEGNIQYSCVNGQGGSYTVNWSGTGGFVCGKGWSPGGSRYDFHSLYPISAPLETFTHVDFPSAGPSTIKERTSPTARATSPCTAGPGTP